MKKVALLLADGFEEIEVVTPVDFLRRAGINVIISSIAGIMVTGAHNMIIQADCLLEALPADLDGVILPGGMPGAANLGQSEKVTQLLYKMHDSNKLLAAICAAPALVLGAAGLLAGRRFCCYPGFEEGVKDGEFCMQRVVIDGHIISSRGPGTAAEFSLALIEYLLDKEAAQAVKQATLIS